MKEPKDLDNEALLKEYSILIAEGNRSKDTHVAATRMMRLYREILERMERRRVPRS